MTGMAVSESTDRHAMGKSLSRLRYIPVLSEVERLGGIGHSPEERDQRFDSAVITG